MLLVAGEPGGGEDQEGLLPLAHLTLNYVRAEPTARDQDGPEIRGGLHFGPIDRGIGGDDAEFEAIRQTAVDLPHLAQESLIDGQDHGPDEDTSRIAPYLLNPSQRNIFAPDVTV